MPDPKQFKFNQVDFELPHELRYTEITSNLYATPVKAIQSHEERVCQCEKKDGCKDMCINRLVNIECSPGSCPCKDMCKNRMIQQQKIPQLETFTTENKGLGVRAKVFFEKDAFLVQYTGEVIKISEFKKRMKTRNNGEHFYGIQLGDLILDAAKMGNISRFINHSCYPNAEAQKWTVNGLTCIGLFALRDIQPGEEVTFYYHFESYGDPQKCFCGAQNCQGVIGKTLQNSSIESSVSLACRYLHKKTPKTKFSNLTPLP